MASTPQDDSTTDPLKETSRSCVHVDEDRMLLHSGTCAPRTCTTLDHIWKIGLWTDRVEQGQKCLCGAHRWGVETKRVKK